MPLPPSIAVALAGQHRRDLLSQAETCLAGPRRPQPPSRARRPRGGPRKNHPAADLGDAASCHSPAAAQGARSALHPQCAARFAGDLSPDPAHAGSAVSPGSAQAV